MRTILIPHIQGAIDFKGENSALFDIDYSGLVSSGDVIGYAADYTGESGTEVWETWVDPDAEPEVISYPTLDWLRNELGESAEFATRAYGLDASKPNYIDVHVFMDAIRDRINDNLIVSDAQYKAGIELIHAVGMIDQTKAEVLLALGGHTLT